MSQSDNFFGSVGEKRHRRKMYQLEHRHYSLATATVLTLGFDSLPNSDIPQRDPAGRFQGSQAQTTELLLHIRFDKAIASFDVHLKRDVGEILAQDGPRGKIVADVVVASHKLERRRRFCFKILRLALAWLKGYLKWKERNGFDDIKLVRRRRRVHEPSDLRKAA